MASPSFRAFLDASVLYPASLRNLLMRLTLAGLYQARWSVAVHEEWVRALISRHEPNQPFRLQPSKKSIPPPNAATKTNIYDPSQTGCQAR